MLGISVSGFPRDSLCSPILRSGTCAVHYVMHHSSRPIRVQRESWRARNTEKQGEGEIYVKLV